MTSSAPGRRGDRRLPRRTQTAQSLPSGILHRSASHAVRPSPPVRKPIPSATERPARDGRPDACGARGLRLGLCRGVVRLPARPHAAIHPRFIARSNIRSSGGRARSSACSGCPGPARQCDRLRTGVSSARASTQAGVRRASVALTSAKFVTTGRSWPRRFLDVHWTSSSPCAKFRTMSNEA